MSQNMMQEEEDGTIRTLMEVGGNRDQFIRVLDDHREECEKEGDYHEAKAFVIFYTRASIHVKW